MQKQNNFCPICGQKFDSPIDAVVDHDHDSGLIRSALHDKCNMGLGFIEAVSKTTSVEEIANRVAAYLNFHKENPSDIIHPRQTRLRREYENKTKNVKIPRLILTAHEKHQLKLALNEGPLPHPNPKRNTSRDGSWNRTAKKYGVSYDRLLAYVHKTRPLSELD